MICTLDFKGSNLRFVTSGLESLAHSTDHTSPTHVGGPCLLAAAANRAKSVASRRGWQTCNTSISDRMVEFIKQRKPAQRLKGRVLYVRIVWNDLSQTVRQDMTEPEAMLIDTSGPRSAHTTAILSSWSSRVRSVLVH